MKILVVYYSRDGMTKKIGSSIADLLQADTEELIDLTNRKGLLGWLFAGRDAFKQKMTKYRKPAYSPEDYDLLVVGSPVWAGNITPAIRTYLAENSGKVHKAAFFACKGGGATVKFFRDIANLSGQKPLAVMEVKKGEELTGLATHKMLQFVDEIKRNI